MAAFPINFCSYATFSHHLLRIGFGKQILSKGCWTDRYDCVLDISDRFWIAEVLFHPGTSRKAHANTARGPIGYNRVPTIYSSINRHVTEIVYSWTIHRASLKPSRPQTVSNFDIILGNLNYRVWKAETFNVFSVSDVAESPTQVESMLNVNKVIPFKAREQNRHFNILYHQNRARAVLLSIFGPTLI